MLEIEINGVRCLLIPPFDGANIMILLNIDNKKGKYFKKR